MPSPLESVLAAVEIEPPFFLRQVRPSAWGDSATPPDQRVEDALRAVFKVDDPAHSLFLISGVDDLRRVVVALCANRLKPSGSKFCFVALSRAELDTAGVQVVLAPEDGTPCGIANRLLHFNATATEDQLRNLLAALFAAERERQQLKEKQLEELINRAATEGCRAGTKPPPAHCRISDCPAAGPPSEPAPAENSSKPPSPST
jgi:hypothetical protein